MVDRTSLQTIIYDAILIALTRRGSALDHRQDTYISETARHTSQRYFKCSKLYINAINTSLQMMHLIAAGKFVAHAPDSIET